MLCKNQLESSQHDLLPGCFTFMVPLEMQIEIAEVTETHISSSI